MSETFDTPAAAAPAAPRALGAWETIREALRGSRQDYTDGPIGRAIVLLAIPMVLEMVLESVFAVVDVFWVSRLGADAIATVGLTESMLALIYSLAMGLSMRSLWLANIFNLIFDPCFIFGLGPFPRLGVMGAAVATTCGRGIGVLFQLWTLSRGRGRVVIRREHLALDPAAMLRLLKISGNGIFQAMVGMASWIGIVRLLAAFGSSVVAGYTIGIRIIVFAILPSWCFANAAATMVGQ